MNEKMIRDAYCRIRTIDNTIPDDVLDFMLEAALQKLNSMEARARYIAGGGSDAAIRIAQAQSAMEHNRGIVIVAAEKKRLTIEEITKPQPFIFTSHGRVFDDNITITGKEFPTGKDIRRAKRKNKPKK
jgi:hypothetical protein